MGVQQSSFTSLSSLQAPPPSFTPFHRRGSRPLVVARGGLTSSAQTHSMSAITAAFDEGADAVSVDIMVTSDEECVCYPYETTDTLVGGPIAPVSSLTWGELQEYVHPKQTEAKGQTPRTYRSEERVALLETVLMEYKGFNFHLHLKAYNTHNDGAMAKRVGWGKALARVLLRTGNVANVVVTSLNIDALRELKALIPNLHVGFWYGRELGLATKEAKRVWFTSDSPLEKHQWENGGVSTGKGFADWLTTVDKGAAVMDGKRTSAFKSPLGFDSTVLHMERSQLRPAQDVMPQLHDMGYSVGTFVFFALDSAENNDEAFLLSLVERGIDFIETDDPEKLNAMLDKVAKARLVAAAHKQ